MVDRMTCSDFARYLNELLDHSRAGEFLLDSSLSMHAEECPRCRELASGYSLLCQAILDSANRPHSAKEPVLVDRVLVELRAGAASASRLGDLSRPRFCLSRRPEQP